MMFFRYIFVQALTYGVDFGVFVFLLRYTGIGPITSNILSRISAGLVAFFIHRNFTFLASETNSIRRQAVWYSTLLLFNLPLSALVLAFFLLIGLSDVGAKVMADIVCLIVNFAISKFFVFLPKTKQ